jgi:predicted enzyme related to lactoylglutathione lyase
MDKTTNSLNWFEIPALDITRAQKFYETIFDLKMELAPMGDSMMAFFPMDGGSGKANGALVQSDMHKPSVDGSIVYLNANPNMDPVIARVEEAGGKVVVPKMSIGEHGNIAFIIDCEGNKMGIHSME